MIPQRSAAPHISSFPILSLPPYRSLSLRNGAALKVFNGGDSPVSRLTFSFDGGFADTDAPAALAVACALMREGTKSYSGEEISELLDYNGAWLKIEPDNHNVDLSLYSLNSRFENLIRLIEEVAFAPSLHEKEFAAIKSRLAAAAEIQERNVMKQAERRMSELFFGAGHPLTKTPPTAAALKEVTIEDVRNLHRQIVSSIPSLTLSGMTDEVERLIDSSLRFETANGVPLTRREIKGTPSTGTFETVKTEGAMQSAVIMSIPTIARSHHDYIGLRLAVMALGGYFGSRLMTVVREEKGLTYGITAHLLGHPEGSEIRIACQTDPSNISRLIDAVKEEIKRMQSEPINLIELEQLKAYAMSALAATLDSPFSIMDYHITIERIGAPANYYTLQQQAIAELTPQIITDLLSKHLITEDAIWVTTTP